MHEPDKQAIDDITQRIQQRVGIYAYQVYDDDRKRWIGEAILGALALGLLKDYVAGFADLKAVGARHRTCVAQLIARVRAGEQSFDVRIEPVLGDIEQARQSLASAADSSAVFEAGKARLALALTELRVPSAEADELAGEIAEAVKPLFG